MKGLLYRLTRDLHLYLGLFVSPYVLVFAFSVFFLVHAWLPTAAGSAKGPREVLNLPLPANLDQLSGRPRIDALRPTLKAAKVVGEVGWIQFSPNEHKLVIPVSVPGKNTTVTIDLEQRRGVVEEKVTGFADAVVMLHKSPGPHLVGLRMNWGYMALWRWLADGTVYLLLFSTVSGLYLWLMIRPARRTGVFFLMAGAISFAGMIYALIH